jgi:hypothetical protein
MNHLIALWYRIRPLKPQYRSREAWIAHQAARGLSGDGRPL